MISTRKSMTRMIGIAIPTSMAVLAIGSGTALAQTTCPDETLDPSVLAIPGFAGYMPHATAVACGAKYNPSNPARGCFPYAGSDTETDLQHDLIAQSGACLVYINAGSGQAETNLRYTAGDSGVTGTYAQCIGPMSRNFQQSVIDGHTSVWQPVSKDNVIAIDAAVWTFKQKTGQCIDLDDGVPATCAAQCPKVGTGSPVLSAMGVILGGYPQGSNVKSEATTAECADPCRECLLAYLASPSCEGSGHIEHILRRDDKSGTQDTFREKLNIDRWCNGKSEGNNNLPGSNVTNEDLDPIRRSCMPGTGTTALTRCTYYPTSQNCQAGDADVPANGSIVVRGTTIANSYSQPLKCSQGVVVALSENDNGSAGASKAGCAGPNQHNADITESIGLRVANDALGQLVGVAGAASRTSPCTPNAVTNINTVTTTFLPNIYKGAYLFSRRLYLENPYGIDVGNTAGCPATNPGEVAGRKDEEATLWHFAQSSQCPVALTVGGDTFDINHGGVQNIDINRGFYAKWEGSIAPGDAEACGNTSCLIAPFNTTLTCGTLTAGVGTPKQNIGDETSNNACNASYPCVANGQVGTGTPLTCGNPVNTSVCPVMPALASNYGCNLGAKCTSGTCVDDGFGVGGGICQ